MADLYEDYGLEMESDNFGADPQLNPKNKTVVKKSSGILGKVVALILGFTIGAGGVVGGVAGTGYFLASQPIKESVEFVSDFAGIEIDYSKYLTEDYAKLTILELVKEIPTIAAKFGNGTGTLNDLNKISPLVSTALDPVIKKVAEFGLTLDKDTLLDTPVGDLTAYITDEAKQMKLADLLGIAGMTETPLVTAMCYDEDGNPTTINDLLEGGPEGIMGNIPLEALLIAEDGVVDPDKDSLIMALAYGNANRYTLGDDNKVTMKQMAYSKDGSDFYDVDGNKVEVTFENGAYTLMNEEETIYLQASTSNPALFYAYKDSECETPLSYKKAMVGDLLGGEASDLFNELELGSLLNVSPLKEGSDPLMLALAYGEEGTHYDIVEVSGEKTVEWNVKDETTGEKYAPRTIYDLTNGATDIFNDMQLGTVLGIDVTDEITSDNSLTYALAFGYEGTHYTIENGAVSWIGDNAPRTVADIKNMNALLNEIRIESALSVTYESPRLLHVLAYGSEGEDFDYIKEGETVVGIEAYHYNTIASLSSSENNLIDSLTIADIVGQEAVEDDLLLSHLGNATLETLPDEIANLTFKQVYPEQIYETRYLTSNGIVLSYDSEDDEFSYEQSGNKYVYDGEVIVQYQVDYIKAPNGEGDELDLESEEFEDTVVYGPDVNGQNYYWIDKDNLQYNVDGYYHIKAVAQAEQYQVHLKLTSQWKYLLQASTDGEGESHDYKMTEFASLVTNMTHNMTNATLRKLNADGIVSLSNETLDTELVTEITITVNGTPYSVGTVDYAAPSGVTKLGDLTITQILDYTAKVMTAVNNLTLNIS